MQDFPFTIRDIAYLMNLHIRHKNTVSYDVDCPFCGDKKGKLNLNLKRMCLNVTGAEKAAVCSPCTERYMEWITRPPARKSKMHWVK